MEAFTDEIKKKAFAAFFFYSHGGGMQLFF